MTSEDVVVSAAEKIDGWLFPDEIRLLYRSALDAIRRFPGLPIVEVGSYKGRSTVALAAAVKDSGDMLAQIHAIDPHEGILTGLTVPPTWETFRRNLDASGVADFVVPIRGRAEDVHWTSLASMLFIDGLHTAAGVGTSYANFYPYVPVGGLIAFHDYANPDFPEVRKFVDAALAAGELTVCGALAPETGRTLLVTRKAATLSIVIPTIGRPSLFEALESIVRNGATNADEVIIVGDGPQPAADQLVTTFSRVSVFGPSIQYFEHGPHRQIGGPQRNFGMSKATGTHMIFIDDDDIYVNDALREIRAMINAQPTAVLLFKEESKVPRHSWGVVWKDREIRKGNVGTQMVVAPNIPGRIGKWGTSYANDYDFVRSTVDLHPMKDAGVMWVDRVIVHLH